jgi:Protein of unknown function (DUF3105)
LAKDRTPDDRERRTGASRSGAGSAGAKGKGGRTRPPATVVAPQRPWGLIIASILVVVFAAAVIVYAVVEVQRADAGKIEAPEEIADIETAEYGAGQEHVTTPVDYTESPPVGGPHAPPPDWADCTGTVYDVDIRHENAVHSLEHGAVWITYNPDQVSEGDIATLAKLAGQSGRMLSPYTDLDSPISIQSWNHQLKVDSADDVRLKQFADFFTYNQDFYPEPGASCENPTFIAEPVAEEPAAAPAP